MADQPITAGPQTDQPIMDAGLLRMILAVTGRRRSSLLMTEKNCSYAKAGHNITAINTMYAQA